MRWIRLTAEESRVCNAPLKVDALGSVALSLFGRWREDARFMILTAYVDESGMGAEQHLTMGGWVFKLGRYQAFASEWSRHLDRNNIPYAHFTEMMKGDPPFAGWDETRTFLFYQKGLKIARRYACYAVTVTMDRALFRQHYKGKFDLTAGDSEFGLAARAVIEYLTGYFDKFAGIKGPHLNMVFDQQRQFGGAAKSIFYETKRLYGDGHRVLGNFAFGETRECCGLQIADFLVAVARQLEPRADQIGARKVREGPPPEVAASPLSPVMHIPIGEEAFELFIREQTTLKGLRSRQRWIKNQLKRAERSSALA